MAREQNLKYGNYYVILFSSNHYRDKDIYRVGHEKVARLPCDILSLALVIFSLWRL
jgi:hypothetical protein